MTMQLPALPCSADASLICPRLYQGSWPGPSRLLYGHPPTREDVLQPRYGGDLQRCGFDGLVLCAQELQDARYFPGVHVMHAPLDDSATRAISELEWTVARRTSAEVARRVADGERILVTCAMGRNRSGLVTALALRLLTGCSGGTAVRLVRSLRPNALTNRSFVERLLQLPGRGRDAAVRRR